MNKILMKTLTCFVFGAFGNVVACPVQPVEAQVFKERANELGLQLGSSAACWVDVNNDGWPDLCCGGTIWRNESGRRFTKLAEGVGEVVAADFDNDGFIDLFSWSTFQMFRNLGGKKFVKFKLPKLPASVSLSACWGDFNGDGYADLFVSGYEDWEKGITYPDRVLLNQKGQSFELAWTNNQYRARGVTACDFDRDGDVDVYVSNYRLQPNQLWINDGAGNFSIGTTQANAVGTSDSFLGGHSIGAAWGDYDNDGLMDLFVGNFAHQDHRGKQPQSRFLRNKGGEKETVFEDRGPCGIFYQESYASPSAGDYDNDGDLDLFFTTIYATASFGKKNHSALFKNEGDLQFIDGTATAKLSNLPPTYQAAWADFDRDGDLDLVTAGKFFQNESGDQHWLELRLKGDGETVNRSAIGAIVQLSIPDRTLTRHVEAGTGQGNQNDLVLHFGLGDHASPVKLTILWPGGKTQTIENVDIDRLETINFQQP